MKNDITTNEEDLTKIETPRLKEMLAEQLELTVAAVLRTAKIVKELERRGVDLSYLRKGFTAYLLDIAGGKLKADAVVKYAMRPRVLKALSFVSIVSQDKIVNQEADLSVVIKKDKGFEVVKKTLDKLTDKEVVLVFSPGGIRSAEEQQKFLESKGENQSKRQKTIKFDEQTGFMKIGQMFVKSAGRNITADDIIEPLEQYFKVNLKKSIKQQKAV